MTGFSHGAKSAPSSEQASVDPPSLATNRNVAVVARCAAGGASVIDVMGGLVSTEKSCVASVGSVLPAGSVAWTASVWRVSVRSVRTSGDSQVVYAAPSTEQLNVEPVSVEAKRKVAVC